MTRSPQLLLPLLLRASIKKARRGRAIALVSAFSSGSELSIVLVAHLQLASSTSVHKLPREEEAEAETEMKRNSDFTVVCLVRVGILACLLPPPSGAAAAADSTWHPNPTRQGHYDSVSAAQRHGDDDSNKASLRAVHRTPAHHHGGLPPLSAPPPTAGADLPSLSPPSRAPEQAPHFGFPLQPTVGFAAPPVASAGAPSTGEGYPFIGSNPTVPLPTGMTDTATVLPLPDRGDGTGKVVGRSALVRVQIAMVGFLLIFSVLFLSWS